MLTVLVYETIGWIVPDRTLEGCSLTRIQTLSDTSRAYDACLCAARDADDVCGWAGESAVAVVVVAAGGPSNEQLPTRVDEVLSLEELTRRALARAAERRALRFELGRVRSGNASLARVLSHDFQAPLRQIDQFAGLLSGDYAHALDETGLRWLSFIRDASKRSRTMAGAMRAYLMSVGSDTPGVFSLDDALRDALERSSEDLRRVGTTVVGEKLPQAWGHEPSATSVLQLLLLQVSCTHREVSVRGWLEEGRAVVELNGSEHLRRDRALRSPKRGEVELVETLIVRYGGTLRRLDRPGLQFSLPAEAPKSQTA